MQGSHNLLVTNGVCVFDEHWNVWIPGQLRASFSERVLMLVLDMSKA